MDTHLSMDASMELVRGIRQIIEEQGARKFTPVDRKPVTKEEQLDADYAKNLSTAYQQLCASYHAIDDFRAKLLGLLPLTTGTGIALLVTDQAKIEFAQPFIGPIAAFGFVITLSLFFYELHGVKKCAYIIKTGQSMECEMKIHGQFLSRPHEVAGFIDEPFTASVIYPAVLAAWTFVGLFFTFLKIPAPKSPLPWSDMAPVLLVTGMIFFGGWIMALRLFNAIDYDLVNRKEKNKTSYIKEPCIRLFRSAPNVQDPCEKKQASQ